MKINIDIQLRKELGMEFPQAADSSSGQRPREGTRAEQIPWVQQGLSQPTWENSKSPSQTSHKNTQPSIFWVLYIKVGSGLKIEFVSMVSRPEL